jgi:tetratricopeptide (TPR) repeat protein
VSASAPAAIANAAIESTLLLTIVVALITSSLPLLTRPFAEAHLIRGRDPFGSTNRLAALRERSVMGRRRLAVLALGASIAAVVLLFGGVLSQRSHASPLAVLAANAGATPEEAVLGRLFEGLSSGDTAGFIHTLERRVAHRPKDGDALAVLALAYQQRARETGDPVYYRLSDTALRRASAATGPAPLIAQGEASLANTRHRFRDGLRLAREAITLDPANGAAYGALGDALLNLGRYRQAFKVYDRMALKAPGIASFTRVANARELIGRPKAAVAADELALEADATIPEQIAWTTTQIGNINFNMGRLAAAAKAYRRALRRLPGYVHAEAGLARVEASEGRYGEAIARLRRAVAVLPIPAYVIWLGDILHVAGHEEDARREYALVGAIEKLYAANGVRTELQTAVFDLDHDRNVADALTRAHAAYASAPSIYAEDALAWGLYRTGRCREARRHSVRALQLGTRDALLVFHRAMIERCLRSPSARSWFRHALAINPHFSFLWAPVARAQFR